MASMPASGPGPKMATNSSAQTSELTERLDTSSTRAMKLSSRLRVRLPATSSPSGTAITSDRMVPSVAMCRVSTSASWMLAG